MRSRRASLHHGLDSAPPAAAAESARALSGARPKFVRDVVLVVDDTEDARELFATVLRREGFVVVTAADGLEALEVAASERPSVIVLDLAMPRMDGFEALPLLRRELEGADAFVIVVSACTDPRSRARAVDAGCDDFLAKPCSPSTLVASVERAFEELGRRPEALARSAS